LRLITLSSIMLGLKTLWTKGNMYDAMYAVLQHHRKVKG